MGRNRWLESQLVNHRIDKIRRELVYLINLLAMCEDPEDQATTRSLINFKLIKMKEHQNGRTKP
tara:strand:+ start:872 stop:1063 length:192 start_codon:yes stop_codon:yes gene_type:complete